MYMQLVPGTKIKSYVLEQRLGTGSSGEVWKAHDGKKTVAIKFMNERLLEGEAADKHRTRLTREIEALKRLQHPHVPALYDYDLHFQRPYLVMQYITSPPLDRLITNGELLRLNVERRLKLIGIVADTLMEAHRLGIIHRDIKPGNINGIDHPYLLDFSVALSIQNIKYTQEYVGTGIYMPPLDAVPDELSDSYSFAVVAYEILFGRHPIFTPFNIGNTAIHTRLLAAERLKKHDWRLPSRVPSGELPVDLRGADLQRLDAIFEKAFGDREQRYRDLRQLVADLKGAILIPANQSYIDFVSEQGGHLPAGSPSPARADMQAPLFTPQPIPAEDRFTMIEVNKASTATDPDPQSADGNNRLMLGAVVLAVIVIVVVALVLSGSV